MIAVWQSEGLPTCTAASSPSSSAACSPLPSCSWSRSASTSSTDRYLCRPHPSQRASEDENVAMDGTRMGEWMDFYYSNRPTDSEARKILMRFLSLLELRWLATVAGRPSSFHLPPPSARLNARCVLRCALRPNICWLRFHFSFQMVVLLRCFREFDFDSTASRARAKSQDGRVKKDEREREREKHGENRENQHATREHETRTSRAQPRGRRLC